jgi:hypothetical protein
MNSQQQGCQFLYQFWLALFISVSMCFKDFLLCVEKIFISIIFIYLLVKWGENISKKTKESKLIWETYVAIGFSSVQGEYFNNFDHVS